MSKCEVCGANQANVHLTQIINGQTTVLHLCEECAQKKGINVSVATGDVMPESIKLQQPPMAAKEIYCSNCRMPFSQFQTNGKLGCSECYRSFQNEIDGMLKQVHGSCVHRGKRYVPGGSVQTSPVSLGQLRIQLDRAVKNEEFELAAAIRDTIRSIEADAAESKNTIEHK
ncbi:MAG: hypothetical protein GF401_13325 [Chitinivibrionales bacterium]|nr:hypothetical protein [Chitinivibrionales bacterium]